MSDKSKFFEMLNSITEIAKVQGNQISRDDIKKLFGDMELDESQYEHVYAYLAANNIQIDGYIEIEGNNEYRQAVLQDSEIEVVEEIESETFKEKVMTKQEEKDSIYLKMYLDDLSAVDELLESEEKELFEKVKCGDEYSKVRLIEGKLNLVVEIAKQYVNKGVLIEDLIGEGNIGLMSGINSIHELDEYSNFTSHLENEIKKVLEEATSENTEQDNFEKRVMERASYLNSSSNELTDDLLRNPTLKELSEYTRISIDEIKDILNVSGDSIKDGIRLTHEHEKE